VKLVVELDPGPTDVLVDRELLEGVLLNLVIHAKQAMPSGGQLTLSTRNVVAGDGAELPRGAWVRVTVADTGTRGPELPGAGAPPRDDWGSSSNGGLALGLAMARRFAERSGGSLAISRDPPRGTTVVLNIPRREP
jgi:signal transduction histidine kinase